MQGVADMYQGLPAGGTDAFGGFVQEMLTAFRPQLPGEPDPWPDREHLKAFAVDWIGQQVRKVILCMSCHFILERTRTHDKRLFLLAPTRLYLSCVSSGKEDGGRR